MSQINIRPIVYVGLDVAKSSLDLHLLDRPYSFDNDAKGYAKIVKLLANHPGAHVVCEATGGYERRVVEALHAAAIAVSVVEAGRVRFFARAKGRQAKTDQIDAAVLAAYGRAVQPLASKPPSANQRALADLLMYRLQVVDSL